MSLDDAIIYLEDHDYIVVQRTEGDLVYDLYRYGDCKTVSPTEMVELAWGMAQEW